MGTRARLGRYWVDVVVATVLCLLMLVAAYEVERQRDKPGEGGREESKEILSSPVPLR